jgi:hypothetical protein
LNTPEPRIREGPSSAPRTCCPWWIAAPRKPRVLSVVCLILIYSIGLLLIYIGNIL